MEYCCANLKCHIDGGDIEPRDYEYYMHGEPRDTDVYMTETFPITHCPFCGTKLPKWNN